MPAGGTRKVTSWTSADALDLGGIACEAVFVSRDPDEVLRRLVIRVLRDEFALDGEGEDGLAEVGGKDGVGVVEEEVEVGRGGRVGKAGQRRAGERGVPRVAFLLLRLQPITQRHQLIHFRHDPLLLPEGREALWGYPPSSPDSTSSESSPQLGPCSQTC